MLNTKKLDQYLAECKLLLGAEWLAAADKTVIGYDTVGSVAKRWCIHCYMSYNSEKDCVDRLKERFEEIK
jgi:hypothetical protein